MKLCTDRRGVYQKARSTSRRPGRCWSYDFALAEVIYDMHDKLKSVTRGYGTMDYELLGYESGRIGADGYLGEERTGGRPVDRLRQARLPTHAVGR